MHVHVLQHVPFEGLGSMAAWLEQRSACVTATRLFETPQWPDLSGIDLVIALGGPMSVNDDAKLAWLADEKQFLADAMTMNKAVLGICLGAQLIANALGAKVYPAAAKEIGWHQVFGIATPADAFVFPASTTVFQWHGETFDLPQGAVALARSEVCPNQAFQLGTRVMGLQFHLETTPASAKALVRHCADELRLPQPYVQTELALHAAPKAQYVAINHLMDQVLTYLVDGNECRTSDVEQIEQIEQIKYTKDPS